MDKKAGKYISYKLKLIGVTHSDIAKQSNLSTSIISHVLNARKSSERAESAIAKALGYESFSDLLEEARREVEKQMQTNSNRRLPDFSEFFLFNLLTKN